MFFKDAKPVAQVIGSPEKRSGVFWMNSLSILSEKRKHAKQVCTTRSTKEDRTKTKASIESIGISTYILEHVCRMVDYGLKTQETQPFSTFSA